MILYDRKDKDALSHQRNTESDTCIFTWFNLVIVKITMLMPLKDKQINFTITVRRCFVAFNELVFPSLYFCHVARLSCPGDER